VAKGYWIVRVDIADPEKYKEYIAANGAPLKKYGAKFLVGLVASRIQKERAERATP
jgi:uncharacterized protein (DUF1330 family)